MKVVINWIISYDWTCIKIVLAYRGLINFFFLNFYFTIKYLATGVVTQKGANVTTLKIGSRIAIENHFFCGSCYSCDVSKKIFTYPGIKYTQDSI